MTPEQLRELERLAAEAAHVLRNVPRRAGERRFDAPGGPAPAERSVVRCGTCNAPLWAQDAARDTNDAYACPIHAEKPLHAPSSAHAICTHCKERVASGVWRYGGEAFGKAWHRDTVLCAGCGFSAVNWLTLIRPELPKKVQKHMTPMAVIQWHRRNPPRAMRYVQWCRLLHDGREAAATFVASLRDELAPEPPDTTFDMSDVQEAMAFLQRVGLAP